MMKLIRSIQWTNVAGAGLALAALAMIGLAFGQQPEVKDAEHGRGYKAPTPEQRRSLNAASTMSNGYRIAALAKFQALPAAFDCREKGWVMPTGDQGNCGSCYLYSTIYYTLTSALIKAGYGRADGSFVMAVQYGMDCHNFGGCGGGWGVEVIDWACKNGWYAEKWTDLSGKVHNDYPAYSARSSSCRKVAGAKLWTGMTWGYCAGDGSDRRPTIQEIKTAMFNYGTLNIALAAGGQFGSGTGTITSLGTNIDHEIACVAWDDAKDGGAFLLHNQWSSDWGNGGFRWCTYKAAANIVDWFWVSAAPLPPPPIPPDPIPPIPPGPDPGPGVLLTINNMLKPGTYQVVPQNVEVVPAGTGAKLKEITAKVAELQKLLEGKGEAPPTIEPAKPEKKPEPKKPVDVEPPLTDEALYNAAYGRALAMGRKLVVGVGCAVPTGDWESLRISTLEGFTPPCIVVSRPEDGEMVWVTTLRDVATAVDVAAAISYFGSQPPASVSVPSLKELDAGRKKYSPANEPRRDPKTGRVIKKDSAKK